MVRIVPTPGLAIRIAVVLDVLGTLFIEQIGFMLSVPAFHPVIVIAAIIMTYVLFRWKDDVAVFFIELTYPFSDGLHKKVASETAEILSTPIQILAHGIVDLSHEMGDAKEFLKTKRIRKRSLEGRYRK